MERPTIDAITLLATKTPRMWCWKESYEEYMQGFTDAATGEARNEVLWLLFELEQLP
ncbi:hypothetical protein M8494_36490 [Serratia ureilytica]